MIAVSAEKESDFDAIRDHLRTRGAEEPVPMELRGALIECTRRAFLRAELSPWMKTLLRVSGVTGEELVDGWDEIRCAGETPAMRPAIMHTVCAWCAEIIQHGQTETPTSHGICRACAKQFFRRGRR